MARTSTTFRPQMQHLPCNPLHEPHYERGPVEKKEIPNDESICSCRFGLERFLLSFRIGTDIDAQRRFDPT
jgi:hypothetical protein